MLRRNPALIVGLRASSDSRAIGTHNSNLLGGIDLLGASRGLLGALATLATALLLGEEGGDPGVVDKIDGSDKSGKEDDVQEYARREISNRVPKEGGDSSIHLWVKDAGGGLDDGDGLVVGGNGEEVVLLVLDHGDELQTEVLGVHLGGEAIGQRLLLAGGDLQAIALAGEVAQDLSLVALVLDQRAADNGDGDGLGLLVVDGQAGLGRVAVDQLDAEDLRLREAGGNGDLEIGRLGLAALNSLFDLVGLGQRTSAVDVMGACSGSGSPRCRRRH